MNKQKNNTKVAYITPSKGVCTYPGGMITFEIDGAPTSDSACIGTPEHIVRQYYNDSSTIEVAGVHVAPWGFNNLYPQEVQTVISDHKLLPSVLEKQIQFLFGNGLMLYSKDADGNKIRIHEPMVEAWLDGFEAVTGESAEDYIIGLITDYYHVQTCTSKWHFSLARRIQGKMPVQALSYVGADACRLALDHQCINRRILNQDCQFVVVADWALVGQTDATVYNRFNPARPFANGSAISFNRRRNFSHDVYAANTWYGGLREWLKASNLTPKYLNSYLENALNAHVHCKIPKSWYDIQANTLEKLCQDNLYYAADPQNTRPLTEEYKGVRLLNDQGKPYQYSPDMVQQLVNNELKRISSMLSGEKNQGKMYASLKLGNEAWEFEAMPGEFKEYFDAVIRFDERADKVTLAGVGINSSITNVENDGQISKSGSDVYYNYIIYLSSLPIAEEMVCRDLNRALKLNFAELYDKGIRFGLDIRIPGKLQDVSPSDRIDAQVGVQPNNSPKTQE